MSAAKVRKVNPRGLPPQAFLGAAGIPGLTAHFGLLRVAALRDGDVAFVSGGAGMVGSMACQIAKIKGNRVVASAGGPAKLTFLREIGVDHAIDYKEATNLTEAVLAGAPEGIDVYFENVGGAHLEAALDAARLSARFALCGLTSTYNCLEPPPGPRNLFQAIAKSIRLEGFSITRSLERDPDLLSGFQEQLCEWVSEGRITWRETVFEGIDSAPEALMALFRGDGIGKVLVKLA